MKADSEFVSIKRSLAETTTKQKKTNNKFLFMSGAKKEDIKPIKATFLPYMMPKTKLKKLLKNKN